MKRLDLIIRALALALALVLALCSCGSDARSESVEELSARFSDVYGALPAGRLYSDDADEWSDGFFSRELRLALFGEDPSEAIDGELRFGVWLGSSRDSVAEFGIFVCESRSDAEDASELCLARIERLRSPMYGNVDVSAVAEAFVCIGGCIAVYAVLPDGERARAAADAVLD